MSDVALNRPARPTSYGAHLQCGHCRQQGVLLPFSHPRAFACTSPLFPGKGLAPSHACAFQPLHPTLPLPFHSILDFFWCCKPLLLTLPVAVSRQHAVLQHFSAPAACPPSACLWDLRAALLAKVGLTMRSPESEQQRETAEGRALCRALCRALSREPGALGRGPGAL